ncbi:MAG: polysaccharide deacetylase family protein [Patescibacteria group bacterium]
MANYKQYQQYRLQRGSGRSRKWRWLLLVVVIILLIWWMRSAVSNNDKNENVNAGENISATEVNANADISSNTNQSADPTQISFDLDNCDKSISSVTGAQSQVALTFNSVSSAGSTESILQILKDKSVKADFFVTGVWLENNSDLGKQIVSEGHGIYSLGYEYASFTAMDEADIQLALEKTDDTFNSVLGRSAKPFFRPPYGSINDDVFQAALLYGYCPVIWTFDAMDWSTDYTNDEIKDRVVERAVSGSIVVMQTSNSVVPVILSEIIDQVKEKGLEFVPLIEMTSPASES